MGPLFAACVAAWGAALLVESASWGLYTGAGDTLVLARAWAWATLLVVCTAAAVALLLRRRLSHVPCKRVLRALALPCIGALCALVCSSLFWASWAHDCEAFQDELSGGGVVAELTSDPAQRDYGMVSVAECRSGRKTVSFRIVWPADTRPLSAGHRVRVTGSFSAPKPDDGGHWNHRQGYVGTLRASSAEETPPSASPRGAICSFRDLSFERVMEAGGGGDAAGLLAGVVLGNRTAYAGSELEQDFRTTGLAHLMAVSGTHLAVVTALLSWALSRTPLPRRARGAATVCCLALYVALTGFAPSALRSFVMCAAAVAAGLARRRSHVISSLSFCVIVFVCADPPLAFSLGFQLSVLAVFGLAVLSPLAECWLRSLLPARAGTMADSIGATLSATLVTLPITVSTFAQFPIVSPLATLAAAPVVTLALGLGVPAVLLCALSLPFAGVLLEAALAVAGACAALVHALADLPFACVPLDSGGTLVGVFFAVATVVLWALWPVPPERAEDVPADWKTAGIERERRQRRAAIVCAVFALPLVLVLFEGFGGAVTVRRAMEPSFASDAQVVMIDVGQGDCMLVRDGRAAVLVDTGEDGQTLERGLARQGIAHLDAVFVTHKDADHCGALPALTGVVGVDHVFVHGDLLDSPVMSGVLEDARWVTGGRGAEGVRPGDRTKVGRFSLTLLSPERGGESGNDDSLVNLLEYDEDGDGRPEARGLLTGDAESGATAPLAAGVGRIDFLKVAHHGSSGGATAEELAELSPKVALIGVGAQNRYGHPTGETLSLLERAGARVYRTDRDGDISLSFSGSRMSVKLQKGTEGQ